MYNLYDRIMNLCKQKGVSGSRMCLDLGLSKSTLSDIKGGRKKGISTSTAQKIASYLGVSVGYLLGEEEETAEKNTALEGPETDRKFLEMLKIMTPEDKELFYEIMISILRRRKKD